jgi:hypothetical protein
MATPTAPQRPVVSEADIILPPPSPLNPIPPLPAALRLDNQEQLLALLQSFPSASPGLQAPVPSDFRQLLVFGTESLRTLMLRQVLNDPHTRTFKGKKKNWESHTSFPLPKSLQNNIVGTRLLSTSLVLGSLKTSTNTTMEGAEVSLQESEEEKDHVDIVTYFLRPWDLTQTQNVAAKIRAWKKPRTQHRIVYIPQPTAVVHKLLADLGMVVQPNVSITKLQLDLFPLESDVLSLEFGQALKEEVEGTPSTLISTIVRSMLKLQDVVGKIPRIQSFGNLGEEVLRKFMNQSVDEYLASTDTLEIESGPVASGGNVAAMLLIDRKVDMVTPMVTPLTYEGLLDEVVGIDCGYVKMYRTIRFWDLEFACYYCYCYKWVRSINRNTCLFQRN